MSKCLTKYQHDAMIKMLKKNGQLTPSGILEEASKEDSPLHNLFEWNNKKAAGEYRLIQARQMIRRVNVRIDDPEDRVVHVPAVKGEGSYKRVVDVVANISDFELALSEALKRLKSSEKSVSELYAVAQTESPDRAAILAVAMKGLETAEAALNNLH